MARLRVVYPDAGKHYRILLESRTSYIDVGLDSLGPTPADIDAAHIADDVRYRVIGGIGKHFLVYYGDRPRILVKRCAETGWRYNYRL